MSDFIAMKTRIAREMKRGEITATTQAVEDAILDAIKHWETKRFWFNEIADTSKSTATSVRTVDISSTNIWSIDQIKVTIGNRDYPITKKSYAWIDAIDQGQWEGYPYHWAWYEKDTLRFYPIPNAVYVLRISGVRRLKPVLAADADTNEWMVEAEEIIRNYAKGLLFTDELRAPKLGDLYYSRAQEKYHPLKVETNVRASAGIVATYF